MRVRVGDRVRTVVDGLVPAGTEGVVQAVEQESVTVCLDDGRIGSTTFSNLMCCGHPALQPDVMDFGHPEGLKRGAERQENQETAPSSSDSEEDKSKELLALRDLARRKEEENKQLRSQISDFKERCLSVLEAFEQRTESSQVTDLAEQLAQKESLISKLEVELIEHPQELAGELSKRKAMLYELIKSQQRFCDLQLDLAEKTKQITQLQSDNLERVRGDGPRRLSSAQRHISPQRCHSLQRCSSHNGSWRVTVAPREAQPNSGGIPVSGMEANAAMTNLASPREPGFPGSGRPLPIPWSASAPFRAMSGSLTVSVSSASSLRLVPFPSQDLPKTAQPPARLLQFGRPVAHEKPSTPLRPGVSQKRNSGLQEALNGPGARIYPTSVQVVSPPADNLHKDRILSI